MESVFISHKHTNQNIINQIKSIRLNSNHPLTFDDSSLADPICNDYHHINRRSPDDHQSKPVKDAIKPLLDKADKLLVLIGQDTHSSLWVQWEINTFTSRFGNKDILLMRIPGDEKSGAPSNAEHLTVHNWDIDLLTHWLKS